MEHRSSRPRLAFVLGDAAGIGPELVAKVVAADLVAAEADLLLVGDERVLRRAAAVAGVAPGYHVVADPAQAAAPGAVALWDQGNVDPDQVPYGKVSAPSGRAMLETLAAAIRLAQQGVVEGVVYAPLNKEALHAGGNTRPDELNYFADLTHPTGHHGELNVLGDLWCGRVTSHVALRDVAALITPERILATVRLVHNSMRQAGAAAPRIGVAALNPHAGEGGLFGDEEITTIGPAVAMAKAAGIDARGPFPSDTLFLRAQAGELDGVVSMYHDQGQIATKLMGFHRGVTVSGGLPVVLSTPAHGTAFDIAGTGRCDPGATVAALQVAARMARGRR